MKCLVKKCFVYSGLIITGDMVRLGRNLLKAYSWTSYIQYAWVVFYAKGNRKALTEVLGT